MTSAGSICAAGQCGGPNLRAYTSRAAAKCLPCLFNGPLGSRRLDPACRVGLTADIDQNQRLSCQTHFTLTSAMHPTPTRLGSAPSCGRQLFLHRLRGAVFHLMMNGNLARHALIFACIRLFPASASRSKKAPSARLTPTKRVGTRLRCHRQARSKVVFTLGFAECSHPRCPNSRAIPKCPVHRKRAVAGPRHS